MTRPASGDRRGNAGRIFGPVLSRRLGLSLGVDVIPYKTCTFDCVYCECGRTTNKTCVRAEFYELSAVLEELDDRLARAKRSPDVITLSGSGEPTLYSRMGELIDGAKRITGLPFAVITNSSLLWRPDVREELSRADIVLPSLDAAIEEDFRRINRPHDECTLEHVVAGLETFLAGYRGTVLFEVLLIEGYNTSEANLGALRETIGRLRTDRIQLNTAVRPGSEQHIEPLNDESLDRIRRFFGPRCEVIASSATVRTIHEEGVLEETILALLSRRPCTALDITGALGVPRARAVEILDDLAGRGLVAATKHGGNTYYSAR
jgi:wyosine [tRNA(Phe)-imidazoG37] synthetase (radical SAM superfamily)